MPSTTALLPKVALLSLLGLAIGSSSSAPAGDLICHTSNPDDCYPRLFAATEQFQTVRDDQDLPPGLHVRMNLETGLREARLNIPIEGEEDPLEGLPTEQSVLVVTPEGSEEVADEPAMRDRVPQEPPQYDNVGKVSPPKDSEEAQTDSGLFKTSIYNLVNWSPGENDDEAEKALVDLSELAHDIYYGVELAKDKAALKLLISLASMHPERSNPHLRHQAASIVGHAVQNNPTALQEARKTWDAVNPFKCASMSASCRAPGLLTAIHTAIKGETDAGAIKAKIYLLNGLMKDAEMRNYFIELDGTRDLLSAFVNSGAEWDAVRVRIGQLMMDNYLDEAMGAELGVWPTTAIDSEELCGAVKKWLRDGCWEHHLGNQTLMGINYEEEWRTSFLQLLQEARERAAVIETPKEL